MVLLVWSRRLASICRGFPGEGGLNSAREPPVVSPRTGGTGPVSIPTPSGNGVLERLCTTTIPLSVPKPHVGREQNLKRAGFARDGPKVCCTSTGPGLNHKLRPCCKTYEWLSRGGWRFPSLSGKFAAHRSHQQRRHRFARCLHPRLPSVPASDILALFPATWLIVDEVTARRLYATASAITEIGRSGTFGLAERAATGRFARLGGLDTAY
jgi:hypothetical protein